MRKANRLALSAFVVLSLAAFAAAQSYTITDLGQFDAFAINSLGDVAINNATSATSFVWSPGGGLLALAPLPGDCCTRPYGINRQGLAVGTSNNANTGAYVAVLWTNGEPLDLGTLPGGNNSYATAISASGVVSGYCYIIPTGDEAFLWTKATGMQGLGFLPGGDSSIANAINRFGQVAGASTGVNVGVPYAFIWSKTTGMTSLGKLPGYDSSSASAINDLGQVAGESDCITCRLATHATLWSKAKGSMLDLGVLPGAASSWAYGINNAGQVVGSSSNGHAFVWSPSTGMLDLNNLIQANSGWALEAGNAINDQGQIVGYGLHNGQGVGFLLTPQ
jgi:probable HAF family extracellular repeat protein